MITTITLNPAIDKSIILETVKLGEVNRITEVIETVGGKGINVSKVLNFFHVNTFTSGVLGRDNSSFFKNYLNHKNIEHSFYEVDGKTRTNVKVIEIKKHRTTDLNEPGIEISKEDLEKIKNNIIELSKKSEYTVLCGSLPKGMEDDSYASIIKEIKKYTIVALDTAGINLKEGVKAGADIIKPNKEELEETYNVKFDSNEDMVKFCKELIENNRLSTILLTLGGAGAILVKEDNIYYSNPIKVNVINTVGAGDSFLGGFLAGKSKNEGDACAFKMAVACGTLAAMQKGTDIFSKEDYDRIINRIVVNKMFN